MAERHPAVSAQQLRVEFDDLVALDGLDLQAPSGMVTAVLGPNGAGKTTLVRCIATLQDPDSGSLQVAGIDARRAGHQVRRRIGLAGQHAAVIDRLTGRENLELVARLYGRTRAAARLASQHVIEQFSLDAFADRLTATYSGGERRRVDLAASLVGAPEVLLLDEPTTGVDPRSRLELWQLIRGLPSQGTSVLLTTQYLEEAAALADHVVIIDQGQTVSSGSPEQLRDAGGTTTLAVRTAQFVPRTAAEALAAALQAEVSINDRTVTAVGTFGFDLASEAICTAVLDAVEVSYRPPTLDEVFLALTAASTRNSA